MKTKFLLLATCMMATWNAYAQFSPTAVPLRTIYLQKDKTVHVIAPENIRYADISTKNVTGDFRIPNLLRLKITDSVRAPFSALLTIVGEKNLSQFSLVFDSGKSDSLFAPRVEILPADMEPLNDPDEALSEREIRNYAVGLFRKPSLGNKILANSYGIRARLNNIGTVGDYIFIDFSLLNSTNLRFDIDEIRFGIEDKKLVRASNAQSVPVIPRQVLTDSRFFSRHYRNVFVFRKFTFPENKALRIQISEKQLSGRTVSFDIRYGDILKADTLEY